MGLQLDELFQHIMDLKSGQAAQNERLKNIEKAVGGNGQPGLKQRIEAIELAAAAARGVGKAAAWLGGSALGLMLIKWGYELLLRLK